MKTIALFIITLLLSITLAKNYDDYGDDYADDYYPKHYHKHKPHYKYKTKYKTKYKQKVVYVPVPQPIYIPINRPTSSVDDFDDNRRPNNDNYNNNNYGDDYYRPTPTWRPRPTPFIITNPITPPISSTTTPLTLLQNQQPQVQPSANPPAQNAPIANNAAPLNNNMTPNVDATVRAAADDTGDDDTITPTPVVDSFPNDEKDANNPVENFMV